MYVLCMRDFINNVNKKEKVIEFLSRHNLNNIDDDIIKNMSFIYSNDLILGTFSYEKYSNIGLVRCFVYSKDLELNNIKKLFKNVCINAKESNCNYLMSFCLEDEEKVFSDLGFNHIDESLVYIEEEAFLDSKYKNRKTYLFSL